MRTFASLATAGALIMTAAVNVSAQSVNGRVIDEVTGKPVTQVHVSLLPAVIDTVLQSILSADGRFHFELMRGATYRVRAQALGYATVTANVNIGKHTLLGVELRMRPDAIALEPLRVVSERLEPWFLRDLMRRQNDGWGKFLMREDLEERMGSLKDVLLTVPGVSIYDHYTGRKQFPVPLVAFRRASGANMGNCFASVYLNGVRKWSVPGDGKLNELGNVDALEDVMLTAIFDIEAIEVYRGVAEVPAEYSGSTAACGVVAIWLRADLRGRADVAGGTFVGARVSVAGVGSRYAGHTAPQQAGGVEVSVQWPPPGRVGGGVSFRLVDHELDAAATAELTRGLSPSQFVLPAGARTTRIAVAGVEPRMTFRPRSTLRPHIGARMLAARRSFTIENRNEDRSDKVTSLGVGLGAVTGAELLLTRRLMLEASISTERMYFTRYEALDITPGKNTAATWSANTFKVGVSYAATRDARAP